MSPAAPPAPVLVTARRTAIGTAGHAFGSLGAVELVSPLLAEAAALTVGLGLGVDDVILGNCMGPGGDVARVAALAAGLGVEVPGVTPSPATKVAPLAMLVAPTEPAPV